jgi:hypothetical protein
MAATLRAALAGADRSDTSAVEAAAQVNRTRKRYRERETEKERNIEHDSFILIPILFLPQASYLFILYLT